MEALIGYNIPNNTDKVIEKMSAVRILYTAAKEVHKISFCSRCFMEDIHMYVNKHKVN